MLKCRERPHASQPNPCMLQCIGYRNSASPMLDRWSAPFFTGKRAMRALVFVGVTERETEGMGGGRERGVSQKDRERGGEERGGRGREGR